MSELTMPTSQQRIPTRAWGLAFEVGFDEAASEELHGR
jgi:hypothetical protein